MPVVVVCGSDTEPIHEAGEAASESRTPLPEAERQPLQPIPTGPSPVTSDLSTGISVFELGDGDCLDFTNRNVELVPCTGEWEYRVLGSFVVDLEGQYPGDDYFAQEVKYKCDLRYTYYMRPTVELWRQGERVVSCFQQNYDLAATDPERLEAGAEVLIPYPDQQLWR